MIRNKQDKGGDILKEYKTVDMLATKIEWKRRQWYEFYEVIVSMPRLHSDYLLIRLIAFCLCLLLLTPIIRTANSKDKTEILTYINMLEDRNKSVRLEAVKVLGEIGIEAKEAIPPLLDLIEDEDKYVRGATVVTLKKIGMENKSFVPILIKMLKDREAGNRLVAALFLGDIGPAAKKAVLDLLAALKDTDRQVYLAAAIALEKIGPAAIPALIEALEDENENVRVVSINAFRKIGQRLFQP